MKIRIWLTIALFIAGFILDPIFRYAARVSSNYAFVQQAQDTNANYALSYFYNPNSGIVFYLVVLLLAIIWIPPLVRHFSSNYSDY